MNYLGKTIVRTDSPAKVTGEALYPGDISFPGQLYMKVLFANRPHAIIKAIDTTEAERVEGVITIITASEVPNNEFGLGTKDQPVLSGPGSNKPFAEIVKFIGEKVALIVAESEKQAEFARSLIRVDYEDLPVIDDPLRAFEDNTRLVHPDLDSNTFVNYRIRKGNVEDSFALADVIVESEYCTPVQEHAYLQPEAGVGYLDEEGRITIIVGGQWTHEDREQVSHALNLSEEEVRIIYPAIGGAFGGREDMSVQIILGLAVYKLKKLGIIRPVKIIWTREESIIGHHKRHPFIIRTKWGATKEGKLVAAEAQLLADGGAYVLTSPKVVGNATLLVTGPYLIPNVKVDTYCVFTNNIPSGAFRGFGGPQGAFAAESQMNKLAEMLHIDPVEFRMRNLLHDGDLFSVGTPLPEGVSIEEVVRTCALKAGWKQGENGWEKPVIARSDEQSKSKGIGFACGYKNIGFSFGYPENCWATIELYGKGVIEKAVIKHSAAEVGQGAHSAIVQMAAEALNIPVYKIELISSDTAFTPNAGSASASRMTFMAGNAIKGAAKEALEKWKAEERPAIATFQYRAPKTTSFDPETGKSEPNFAYGYVAEAVFSTVDKETGQIDVDRVICVDDVGLAVNPQQVEGQIEGAVVQANGYGITERFIQKNGIALTTKFSTYLIPTALDIPQTVELVVLENADKRGPWGIKGMGEMPYLPYVPALVASIKDAIGKWIDKFPMTPELIWEKIQTK